MNIKNILSKQTTLFLVELLILSTLLLPLTTLRAATLTNGMNASYVLGQPDFSTFTFDVDQNGGAFPLAATSDGSKVYILESSANRVLVFDISGGITNGMNASYVLGQSDFTSSDTGTTASSFQFNDTSDVTFGDNKLFISDGSNSRVLVFDISGGITNGMNASYVLGQSDFTSSTTGTTADTMKWPGGLSYDSDNDLLYVTDGGNNRVLVFDISGGITNGMNASYVLGQSDFTSSGTGTTAGTLKQPLTVLSDPTDDRLFVSDGENRRVLVFDVTSITNGEAAVNVLGQSDFTSNSYGVPTASNFTGQPFGLGYDSTNKRLFVSDSEIARVLVFDVTSITNGEAAVNVLGQSDFTSSATGTGAGSFTQSGALHYDTANSYLFAFDFSLNRTLIFDLSSTPTPSTSPSLKYTHPALCTATFSPSVITEGQSTTLSWNIKWPTERTSTYYTKVPKEGLYSDKVSSIQVQPGHTTNYRIAVFNLWGASFCESTITVLNKEGQEILPENPQNLTLSAGASNHPLVRPILSLFSWLFVR